MKVEILEYQLAGCILCAIMSQCIKQVCDTYARIELASSKCRGLHM